MRALLYHTTRHAGQCFRCLQWSDWDRRILIDTIPWLLLQETSSQCDGYLCNVKQWTHDDQRDRLLQLAQSPPWPRFPHGSARAPWYVCALCVAYRDGSWSAPARSWGDS